MTILPGKDLLKIKDQAVKISHEAGHFYLGVEHLFLALLEEKTWINFFSAHNLEPEKLREKTNRLFTLKWETSPWEGILETPRLKTVLKLAEKEALVLKAPEITPQHFLLALLREGKSIPAIVLKEFSVSLPDLAKAVLSPQMPLPPQAPKKEDLDFQRKHPNLSRYGRELTWMAKEKKLDPVVGRKDEIRRVMQILTRKTKNNPVLIGEAGVGKTAVVYGLAQRIARGEVPKALEGKKIVDLNLPGIVAGAIHRGEFEERLQAVIKEVEQSKDIILFIDEIHTIMGAGDSRGGMDAGNILKPVLVKGDFPCLGATTISEYRKYIEADPALERRFQPVLINEPSENEALEILKGLQERYETHHGVKFEEAALLQAIKLAVRFLPDRHLPDKAIDLIDETASRIKMSTACLKAGDLGIKVTPEDIAYTVSLWTGIPVMKLTQEETQKLIEMENILTSRVIGQGEAVKAVAQTIRMLRMGFSPPNRPGGVFLFLGPTGVGKTELAKTLAEFLFGSEKDLIRMDMSEYMEKQSVARLIGSPPGYVGYEEEGQLTRQVRTKPYSVILLDEIEKAHPEVFDMFLQVFDDARLTDGKGRTVNFANTIIIMTSNLGTSQVNEKGEIVLRDSSDPKIQEEIQKVIRLNFRPEFLNRIDEIIIFHPLGKTELDTITEKHLKSLADKLQQEKGLTLEITPELIAFLQEKGFNPAYGARPMVRAIQSHLTKPLAQAMIEQQFKEGETIQAQNKEGKIIFSRKQKNETQNEGIS